MKRTVLEYAVNDKFLLLFLTADGITESTDLKALNSVNRDRFDPELVADFEASDDLGVPDNITCSGVEYNITEDGIFDGHPKGENKFSFKASSMSFTWFRDDADETKKIKHREDGPAVVDFKGFCAHHKNGVRSGFDLDDWKFKWYINDNLERPGGPYSINGDKVNALITPDGEIMTLKQLRYFLGWNHPSGHNLIESTISKAIRENSIGINRVHPGESVFDNEMERAFFYAAT